MTKITQIKTFLQNMSSSSGVYLMRDDKQTVLYVGKAKNLKKRLSQYFLTKKNDFKTQRLTALTSDIEVIITQTEVQALLLENEQIKQHKPRYNILLKDDKSYPYIHLTNDKHARILLYRGVKKQGQYFGPYPSASLVRHSMRLLQKIFRLRTCRDSVYRNRSRPCLEYQIKRCSAPCVGKISDNQYQQDIDMTRLFLSGNNQKVLTLLADKMQQASDAMAYEKAARYRDQLVDLRKIQERSLSEASGDMDVIYVCIDAGLCCVQLLCIRQGKQISQHSFFPKNAQGHSHSIILTAFLTQYYLQNSKPPCCLLSHVVENRQVLSKTLGMRLIIKAQQLKKQLLDIAKINAENAIEQKRLTHYRVRKQLQRLGKVLALECLDRIECFDISHTSGTLTTASCVVFSNGRPDKKQYRQFNIKGITAADDYAAMKQVLLRRYQRQTHKTMPNLIFIDGGKGQLTQALAVCQQLAIKTMVVAIAKGDKRKPGLETLIVLDTQQQSQVIKLPPDDLALLLINHIRDEAHRFAIGSHRRKRLKKINVSSLQEISGVGKQKSRALLNYFGGLQELKSADVNQLMVVNGIDKILAQRIVQALTK